MEKTKMSKDTIQVLNEELRLRPSAIDGFFGCSFQWGKTFLEGVNSIPNSRAAIGTAIHAAVDTMWKESIAKKDKVANMSTMLDAAVSAFKEEEAKGMQFGEDEDSNSCVKEIMLGTETFVEDILPYSAIPVATETFLKIDLEHKMVKELGGTVDYMTSNTIGDLKTGKRKPTVSNYSTQQSIYTYLAKANGIPVESNIIQSVVLKKQPEGMILPMPVNVPKAKDLVNIMLDTLDIVYKDIAPIETILRPNPKYMFCSQEYCAFYGKCPATKNGDFH